MIGMCGLWKCGGQTLDVFEEACLVDVVFDDLSWRQWSDDIYFRLCECFG